MTIGTSVVLIAIGAILKWAVTAHLSWINVQTTGTVLFIVGLAALVLSLLYTFAWTRRDAVDPVDTAPPPPPRGYTRP